MPATALVRDGDRASIWRVKDKKIQKTLVVVGERNARSGEFALVSGLADGDSVIRYPATNLKDGQNVQLAAAPGKAAANAVSPAAKSAPAADARK